MTNVVDTLSPNDRISLIENFVIIEIRSFGLNVSTTFVIGPGGGPHAVGGPTTPFNFNPSRSGGHGP